MTIPVYYILRILIPTFQREKYQKRWDGRIPSQTLHKPFKGILPLKIPYKKTDILHRIFANFSLPKAEQHVLSEFTKFAQRTCVMFEATKIGDT